MALKNIIDSIFGNTLKEDWRDILKEFKDSILDLETQHGLNYKFKYHFLFEHIPYYVEKYGALGKYNEQTIEVRWRFINQFFSKKHLHLQKPQNMFKFCSKMPVGHFSMAVLKLG